VKKERVGSDEETVILSGERQFGDEQRKGDRQLCPPERKIGRLAACGVGKEKPVPFALG